MVAYKYGRGYWTPHAEVFHWFERWAWRVAILVPIYQNCNSGHWKNGNARFPWLGKLLHNFIVAWTVGFVFLQIICSDCFRFYFFVTGHEVKSLPELLGIETPGVDSFHPFNYHGALVVMWVTYLVVMLTGFTRYHMKLEGTMHTTCKSLGSSKLISNEVKNLTVSTNEPEAITASPPKNITKPPKIKLSPQNSVSRLYRRTQSPDSPPINSDPVLIDGDEILESVELGRHPKIERL